VTPTGAWAVRREAGLEHPNQGNPNKIAEAGKKLISKARKTEGPALTS
jgi:hypothetical protein